MISRILCGIIATIFAWIAPVIAANPASENKQIISGDCNVVVNIVNGEAPNIQPTYCTNLSAIKGMADAVTKIARFLEVTNPTEVKLSTAQMEMWAVDAEEYLTLTLSNVSKLPAEKLRIQLLEPVRPGEKSSRGLAFTPSQAISKSTLSRLSVPAQGEIKIPVAPLSELLKLSKNKFPNDYEFMGSGTSPNIPDEVKEKFAHKHHLANNYFLNASTSSVGIEIKYDTIFDGNVSLFTGIYLYFGKISPTQKIVPFDHNRPGNSPS
ncbi:hypothetical protein HX787_28350 [Pseudomonas tolaasii]|uniref:Uncharacterized protein n=2 Tax=Pseudomonas tolaasii TaxID=29442 RepID=A0A7Y8ATF4_PSETO|nr:hypothetical protein [Pseudomonas tolaasii]ARB31269.1 hypothetical protein B5P22_29495 [Pseudomonas tolaasii]KAB0466522.1 hypothetical protein F7R12_27530 [Pseudomonas tolaasii]MBY8943490.1 hypothetical protein [Pseudomonas tolaasii]NVZ45416.1 hypothetical protein [Pseudomonas tolaasii]NWA48604.1 hypothetical protein [Pseudomonas tolaasii]